MYEDIRKMYSDIHNNATGVKSTRDRLYQTIAQFLTEHMSSSERITTYTERRINTSSDTEDETNAITPAIHFQTDDDHDDRMKIGALLNEFESSFLDFD